MRRALNQVGLALHPPGGGREEQGLSASYLTGIRMEIDKDGRRKRRGESPYPRTAGGKSLPPRNSLVEEVLVCACSHGLQGAEREGRGMRLAQR